MVTSSYVGTDNASVLGSQEGLAEKDFSSARYTLPTAVRRSLVFRRCTQVSCSPSQPPPYILPYMYIYKQLVLSTVLRLFQLSSAILHAFQPLCTYTLQCSQEHVLTVAHR